MKATQPIFLVILFLSLFPICLHSQDSIEYKKLYLHTDREFYFLSDSIWFKAYYLDGQSNKLVSGIYSMYVELVDNNGQIIYRKIYSVANGVSAGQLVISDTITTGEYLIRAYTEGQLELGEDAFFHKKLVVSKIKSVSDMAEKPPIAPRPRIDVTVLPEGGILLSGQTNTISIKAINEAGLGINIQGEILSSKGDTVTSFETKYKGMVSIPFRPEEGESYSLNVPGFSTGKNWMNDAVSEGIKIEFCGEGEDQLSFRAISNSDTFINKVFHFAIMSRGQVVYFQEFVLKEMTFPMRISRSALPPGIIRFVLFDENTRPISERLYFSENYEVNDIQIKPDQLTYSKRSQVDIELLNEEEIGESAISYLSVAIVDEKAISEERPGTEMLSWLLINSELKGYIEDPSAFFIDSDSISSSEKLDLLMTTQGWSSYIWNRISENSGSDFHREAEGISISGEVRHALTKKAVQFGQVDLKIYNNIQFFSAEDITDLNGKFAFDGFTFFDSATVFLQARNEKEKLYTIVTLDSVFKLGPNISNEYKAVISGFKEFPVRLYQQQFYAEVEEREYTLKSGSIFLEGVTVYGEERTLSYEPYKLSFTPDATYEITPDEYRYQNVMRFARSRRRLGINPLYLLDGNPVSRDIAIGIPMSEIYLVGIVSPISGGALGVYGENAEDGIIALYTIPIGMQRYRNPYIQGTISARIEGYSEQREFYSPKYTPGNIDSERPDHRNTLYWNPDIVTKDGKASFSFFTSDDVSRYKVIVEGITQIGEICQGSAEIEIGDAEANQE